MRRRSLRTVLTVWNAVALSALLGVFGTAIVFANQNRVRAAMDESLRLEARRAAGVRPPRPGGPGMMGQPGPGGPGNPPGVMGNDGNPPIGFNEGFDGPQGADPQPQRLGSMNPVAEGLIGQGPPGQGPMGRGPGQNGIRGRSGPPSVYEDAARLSDIRRPRFFDVKGGKNPNDPVSPFDTKALESTLRGEVILVDTQYQNEPIRVISAPMLENGHVIGAVQVAQEMRNIDLLWRTQLGTLFVFLPLAILAAAGGAYALTGRTLSPIRKLTRAASEISHSDLSRRLEVAGDDEIAELALTFNQMLGRLQTSFSELEGAYGNLAKAYDQQQWFTADAAHELRTPLTRLRLATSAALSESKPPEEMRRALQTADRAATSMTRLVQDLLTLAKADTGQLPLRLEPVDLRVVVAEALENVAVDRPIDTAFSDRPLMVQADAEHLQRVITNLVGNASRHTPESGSIRVEAVRSHNYAVVTVRDTGEGIPQEHLPHIFDRFYRADSARARHDGGSGLGLAICKNLVEAHGGRIEIESSPGVGTTVRTIFPIISNPILAQTKSS